MKRKRIFEMKTYSSPFLVESGAGIETHTDGTCSGNEGQGVAPQTPPVHLQVCISRELIISRPRICQRWECYMHVMISAGSSRGSLFVDQGPMLSTLLSSVKNVWHIPQKFGALLIAGHAGHQAKLGLNRVGGLVYNLAKLFVRLTN
jgi:hypothetical protein